MGPRGGRERRGALPQGPGLRESRRKDGAGDFSANCRAQPAPRPGTAARGPRRVMLMPRSRRGPGRARRISQPGSPRAAEGNRWRVEARPRGAPGALQTGETVALSVLLVPGSGRAGAWGARARN